jgi:hypothetical protein
MTRKTNARIAGAAYLIYIVVAFPMLRLYSRATRGDGIDAKLTQIAAHASDVRLTVILTVACTFIAFVLAIAMWNITRDEDAEIAMVGLVSRIAEGLPGAIFIPGALGLLWLTTASGSNELEPATTRAIGELLLQSQDWSGIIAAMFFAVGSTAFAYLFLRGRIIPTPLALLGLVGSMALAVSLPFQLAGYIRRDVVGVLWIPLAAYEIPLGFWLIIKGAAVPQKLRPSAG